jgi:hypothetical protein
MQEEEFEARDKKNSLALAIARGNSIAAWARKNNVPLRSAYRWASDPEVRESSELWRRRALNQAIGRMTRFATKAADGIAKLATVSDSDSIRLRAWRAILADQMAVAKFSILEDRMTELEEWKKNKEEQQGRAVVIGDN